MVCCTLPSHTKAQCLLLKHHLAKPGIYAYAAVKEQFFFTSARNSIDYRMTCDMAFQINLSEYDIVGLGSGIYFTSHHPLLLKIAENLNEQQKVFIFSTHGNPFLGKYHSS